MGEGGDFFLMLFWAASPPKKASLNLFPLPALWGSIPAGKALRRVRE
jgi:hypothetical protein